MIFEESHIDLFDKYLENLLTPSELADFEEQLENDTEFKAYFDSYIETVQLVQVANFREELKEVTNHQSRSTKVVNWWIPLTAAAAILFIVTSLWVYDLNSDDSQELFSEYYNPYPNILATRDLSNNGEQQVGLSLYGNKKYREAVEILGDIKNPTDTTSFYIAVSYLSLGEQQHSINTFNKIEESSVFNQQATWYTALAYLSNDDPSNTATKLREIKPQEYRYKEAQEILKELDL